jgi:protein-L-isoaspartate O-methyltransferase
MSQTISAPHMHAAACEALAPALPAEGGRVLDVGVGSGYLAAVFARMVGGSGKVFGLDCYQRLVNLAEVNIRCGGHVQRGACCMPVVEHALVAACMWHCATSQARAR